MDDEGKPTTYLHAIEAFGGVELPPLDERTSGHGKEVQEMDGTSKKAIRRKTSGEGAQLGTQDRQGGDA